MSEKLKYFISFAYDDNATKQIDAFKTRLQAKVAQRGLQWPNQFECYYSPDDTTSHGSIEDILSRELDSSHFLVPLLSPSYLNPERVPRNWCLYELDRFVRRRGAKHVIPVCLETVTCPKQLGPDPKHHKLFITKGDRDKRLTEHDDLFDDTIDILARVIAKEWEAQKSKAAGNTRHSEAQSLPIRDTNVLPLKLSEKNFLVAGDSLDGPFVQKVRKAIESRGARHVTQINVEGAHMTAWRRSVEDSHVVVLVRSKGEPTYVERRAIDAARHIAEGDARADVRPGKNGRMVVIVDAAKDSHEPSADILSLPHLIKVARIKRDDPGACAKEVLRLAAS